MKKSYLCNSNCVIMKENKKVYLIAGIITLLLLSLIPITALLEERKIEKLDHEGKSGVVNVSDHDVKVVSWGRNEDGVRVKRCWHIKSKGEVVLKEHISRDSIRCFPPEGYIDSALVTFDDTLTVLHVEREGVWSNPLHLICDLDQWTVNTICVSHGDYRHRPKYYLVHRYTFTNEDYTRAAMPEQ